MMRMISMAIMVCALAAGVIYGSLYCGVLSVDTSDIINTVCYHSGFHATPSVDEATMTVIWNVRLKRACVAFIVGMALSVSGAVFQALLRNPLADPHIIGVSSGGALGAVLAAACGMQLALQQVIAVPLFSFLGSVGALLIVYLLSRRNGVLSLYSLLLIGVILNSFFVSVVIFIESVVSSDQLASIFFWLLGNVTIQNDSLLMSIGGIVMVGVLVLFTQARAINVMTMGEEKAQQLGVATERVKNICFLCAAVITGVSVAISGLIGFVGLVVPHMVRLVVGPDHRLVLPLSAVSGGMFLVISDTIARTILLPQELPVGVVTSFIGAPFFIVLLKYREQKRIL